ncbi:hypothetical protein HP550_13190 [Cellulomonas humilata]|uniref:Uncharacterized protein n=1 Tax=Cellulomonas humilata TaxID=144055 RepID=A0A7Y6DY90_9CELL|nr:hypothetical protein [Cellulomonas humilata]NUU18205.1 hypothetical protein [Cellulomonas humilata]
MSNPYAPPEDRPRTPDGDRADAPAPQDGPSWPPPMPMPVPRTPVALEPEPQPPDPVLTARAAGLTRLFGVLVLASVLVATLPLPWQAPALLFALPALVVGVRALGVAARARTRGLVPLLAAGVVVALLWTTALGVMAYTWPALLAQQKCLEGALTISATSTCESQYQKELSTLLTPFEEASTGS